MNTPRGLTAEEAAAWAQVASTVKPMAPNKPVAAPAIAPDAAIRPATVRAVKPARATPAPVPPPAPRPKPATLDAGWDRKLARGTVTPDLTLDLHGHTLDTAYPRLMDGIEQARLIGARTVLLVTGKSRPVAAADRAGSRGAIRAKVLDWLAASRHHAAIAAVRKAHIRHGGEGALYIVLRRER